MASPAAEPFSSRIDRRRLVFAIFLLPLFDALLGSITIPFLIRTDAGLAAGSGQASVVFATLSGVLGLLVTITAAEEGRERRRRYYSLTAAGRRVLARQRTTWRTFVNAMQLITGVDHA
jgi:hypothetical protein